MAAKLFHELKSGSWGGGKNELISGDTGFTRSAFHETSTRIPMRRV